MTATKVVAVLGATSMVGKLVLRQLVQQNYRVVAYSSCPESQGTQDGVVWRALTEPLGYAECEQYWLCLCPIWALPQHFDQLLRPGVRRIVAMSSTSRFTKSSISTASSNEDNILAKRLEAGEDAFKVWASMNSVDWVILRPTMIYDLSSDENLRNVVAFIRRYHFFPLLGAGGGQRQPVHAKEVADAALAALWADRAKNQAYQISGGETLTYRQMIVRLFQLLGLRPMLVEVPEYLFRLAIYFARLLPRYRDLSISMALRMSEDLVFDHKAAIQDLGFDPGPFLAECSFAYARQHGNKLQQMHND